MPFNPKSRSRRSTPATDLAARAGSFHVENLEPRQLLSSSFVYTDLLSSIQSPDSAIFAEEYGGAIAAVGDIDGDGVSELLIGRAFSATSPAGAALFSGKTGAQLRTYEPDGRTIFGWNLAALGDVDADGTPDYAVGSGPAAGFYGDPDTFLANVYSGKTGAILYQYDSAVTGLHSRVFAAGDVNGDGHADFMLGSNTKTGSRSPEFHRLTMISGADGSTLFERTGLAITGIRGGTDFNGDDVPDIVVSTTSLSSDPGHLKLLSGVDGSTLFTLVPPAPGFSREASLVGDVDRDGIADIAVATRPGSSGSSPQRTFDAQVYIYSGRDQSIIAVLGNRQPDPLEADNYIGPIISTDLNGDGFNELVASVLPSASTKQANIVTFDGLTLGNAVFAGTSVDVKNNLVGWGTIGHAGFIYFRGQATYLKDIPGFSPTDQIIKFTTHSGGYLIVAAPEGDQSRAFAWYGDFDLQNPNVYTFSGYGPAVEDFTFQRVIDATNGQVMLQYAHAGDSTPAIFFFQLVVDRLGLVPRLSYAVDGVGIAVDSERYIYTPPDEPDTTVIVDFAGPQTLENFKPIDMRLTASPTGDPRVLILGLAQRDGDAFERPYLYDALAQAYIALPLIDGGTDWNPLQLNGNDSVVGTYKTAAGKTAVFYTRSVLGTPVTTRTFDVTSGDVVGAPDGFGDAIPNVLGLRDVLSTGPNEIFITHQGRDGIVTARLAEIEQRGPFGSTPSASMATSEDGSVIVTTNLAGDLLVYLRNTHEWFDLGDWYTGDDANPVYDTPYFGDIVTWTQWSLARPSIAITTDQGLILIESRRVITFPELPPVVEERYVVRNLTTEVAGSEPIAGSLLTFLPQDGRRVIGGLTADGDLVIYGMNEIVYQGSFDSSIWNWAYGNLTDQVFRAFGLPVPTFNTDKSRLVSYVTAWDGQNIAAVVGDGLVPDVVAVFWTSPAIQGWRYTVIGPASNFRNLSVYLTPWGGINIVGGDELQVYWWVPGQESWQTDVLTQSASGDGPRLRSETVTSYTAPWGGLNVAGLDGEGQLWVYWWAPTMSNWTAERITTTSTLPHIPYALTGKLASAVSVAGFDIYGRTLSGDILRYFWSPNNPWMVENISVAI